LSSNPFKAANGQHYIRQIFYELNTEGHELSLYTLKDYDIKISPEGRTVGEGVDGRTLPSIHNLYVATEDPSEYLFANKYFDNWGHWQKIANSTSLKEYVTAMREELAVKLMARSLNSIKELATGDTRDSFQANKYLLEKGWASTTGRKGRPTKDSVKKEAELLLKDKEDFKDDFDRMIAHGGPPLGGIVNIKDYKNRPRGGSQGEQE